MKNLTVVFAAAMLLCLANVAGAQTQIDGDWKITSGEFAGETIPKDILSSMTLKINGKNFDAQSGERSSKGMISNVDSGRSRRGPTKALFKIDSGDDSGREIKALYQMTGAVLKIAFSQNGEFPEGFNSTSANKVLMLSYKNSKAQMTAAQKKASKLPRLSVQQLQSPNGQ